MSTSAVYVYCVVKADRKPPARDVDGLAESSAPDAVRVSGSLWLIVSDVPLSIYGPAALEPKLHDLDWVARVAVAHETVVERFARARGGAVVPMKLFTMFSTREKAVLDVADRRGAIEKTMRRIAGCEEWGVRVRRAPGLTSGRPGATARGTATAAGRGAGAAFLTARKAARDAEREARAAAIEAAEGVVARLTAVARDTRQRPRGPEQGTNPPILEAAFLVPTRARARFRSEARRQAAACATAGAEMTLTGPWPAYNFVTPEGGR